MPSSSSVSLSDEEFRGSVASGRESSLSFPSELFSVFDFYQLQILYVVYRNRVTPNFFADCEKF